MTMLSAQPVTLTGEQHDRLWGATKKLREAMVELDALQEAFDTLGMTQGSVTTEEAVDAALDIAADIERILIDAQDAAPPAQAAE